MSTRWLVPVVTVLVLGLGVLPGCGGGGGGGAPRLNVTLLGAAEAGQPVEVVVEAVRGDGRIGDFTGEVTFSSTDGTATLPEGHSFAPAHGGRRVFEVVFHGAGEQRLTVAAGTLGGATTANVAPGPHARFRVDIHPMQPGIDGLPFAVKAAVVATDAWDNPVPNFDAGSDPVELAASPDDGDVSGLSGPGHVLDGGDFVNGRANLVGRAVFDWKGVQSMHRFTATSASGRTGTSGDVEIVDRGAVVSGFARFGDVAGAARAGPGDTLVIPFDRPVSLASLDLANLDLVVDGHSLGAGASVAAGPAPNEITVTLGTGARLDVRQVVNGGGVGGSTATGIDLRADEPGLRDVFGLPAARSGTPIDVVPGFVADRTLLGRNDTRDAAHGDLDGDGDRDLVCANFAQASCVYRNAGNGSFTTTLTVDGTDQSLCVAVGDLDGDGDQDLVFGQRFGASVWLNDGSARFARTAQSLGDDRVFDVALGDLDHDGDLDLVAAEDGPNRVWRNDGEAGFTEEDALGDALTTALCLADLDGDGRLDLIAGDDGLTTYRNDRTGGLVRFQNFSGGGVSCIAVGSLNRDGRLDVAAATLSGVRLYFGAGGGALTQGAVVPGTTGGECIAVFDLDANGAAEVATRSGLFLNDGKGELTDIGDRFGEEGATAIMAGRLDQDADTDLLFVHDEDGGNSLHKGSVACGEAAWHPAPFPLESASLDTELADLDGDGDLDLLAVTGDALFAHGTIASVLAQTIDVNRIWENVDGRFTRATDVFDEADIIAVATGDVDGDGDVDIAAVGRDGDRIWLNRGDATFEKGQLGLDDGDRDAITVRLVDVDGDCDLDVLVGSKSGALLRLNDGAGNFGAIAARFGAGHVRKIAIGDVDSDGDMDVVTGILDGANRVWINRGGAEFVDSGQALGLGRTQDVWLGDVDNDGDLDIVTGNYNQPNHVYENDGAGTFTDTGQSIGDDCTTAIALIDLDCDGDLDLVEGRDTYNDTIWENLGGGKFATRTEDAIEFAFGTTFGYSVGDIDNDGDLDFVQSNFGPDDPDLAGGTRDNVYYTR